MDPYTAAKWYTENGFSVIPVKADGSKAPLLSGWRKYATDPADEATLEGWFGGGQLVGIGVVPGPASGNLVVLDFEHDGNESAYLEWLQRIPDDLRAVAESVPTVCTPSGGRHLWVRLEEPQPGAKLARYASGKTKIEIRGEGHQVLAPGCPAECHKSGKLYAWAGDEPPECAVLAPDVWQEMVHWACRCNEFEVQEQPRDRDVRSVPAGEDSPGNDFNLRGSWQDTGLFDAGWTWAKEVTADRGFVTRPGKDGGISASVGMVSSKESGYPYLYVWSTSAPDFAPETPYSRFAVYAILKHKGDYSEAAKELARLGFGGRPVRRKGRMDFSNLKVSGVPVRSLAVVAERKPPAEVAEEARPFKWSSELSSQAEDAKWIWEGFLVRQGITLFSALWKTGKSTLLSHMLKAFDGSQTQFLGKAVSPARVLYVTEESEDIWAGRRDALLLGDHCGFACRPFKVRPSMPEWKTFLATLKDQVHRHHFDLVVFDTLSKMWPVREENNAGEVEEALMPLWAMADEGVSILLVHHCRKSGGEGFVSSRGSGGLPAFCEIILEFGPTSHAPKETKRKIKGQGRYNSTPREWLCELLPSGYVGLGDPDDLPPEQQAETKRKRPDWDEHLQAVLKKCSPEWLTFNDIQEYITESSYAREVSRPILLNRLNEMIDSGEMERQGEGKKNNAYEYRLVVL